MKNLTVFALCLMAHISVISQDDLLEKSDPFQVFNNLLDHPRIPVLNLGTFHMGQTSDAHKTEFDERDEKNKREVHEIAKMISAFKPTVIVVERVPERNEALQTEYASYKNNPTMHFENPSEIQLLAYEVGRLCGVEKIYGIDHKMSYDYTIATKIENTIDPETYGLFAKQLPKLLSLTEELSTLDKLRLFNTGKFLDFAVAGNADVLTLAGTDGNFEGADEASKYYQRNLRMFSNLSRIPLTSEDRVFVLMGASHSGFFQDFLRRSIKFEAVDALEYLR